MTPTAAPAVDDILRDLGHTLVNAATRGGDCKADAERSFAALVAIADEVGRELVEIDARLQPLRAASTRWTAGPTTS